MSGQGCRGRWRGSMSGAPGPSLASLLQLVQKLMSAPLSKELRAQYGVRSLPVRKDDEIMVTRGKLKDKMGAVKTVYRKKWSLYFQNGTLQKMNAVTVDLPVHPSNVVITKIKMDKDRLALLERKKARKEAGMAGRSKDVAMN